MFRTGESFRCTNCSVVQVVQQQERVLADQGESLGGMVVEALTVAVSDKPGGKPGRQDRAVPAPVTKPEDAVLPRLKEECAPCLFARFSVLAAAPIPPSYVFSYASRSLLPAAGTALTLSPTTSLAGWTERCRRR